MLVYPNELIWNASTQDGTKLELESKAKHLTLMKTLMTSDPGSLLFPKNCQL